MMDLDLFRSLSAVVEHGTITEAARATGLSQPALSRRIKLLEEALGAGLLERSRRGAVPTELGRMAEREGRELLARYERLRQGIGAQLRHEAGTVRLGGGATAVSSLLPPAIARFQRRYPDVLFQLKEAGSREIEADVVQERLELGIVTLPVASQELWVQPLRVDRIVLVAGKGHPLAHKRRVQLSDLRGQGLVGFEADSAIRRLIDRALREAGVEMNVVMELRSIAAILRLVATTQNLGFVSELGLGDDRRVKQLAVRGLDITRALAVIRKQHRPASPAAAAFLDQLQRDAG
jgi:molybdate transport repressor ModE-like protein